MKKVILFTLFAFSISAQAGMYDDLCLEYGPIQKRKISEVDLGIATKIKTEKKISFESLEKEFCGCMKVELFNVLVQEYQYDGHDNKVATKKATQSVNSDKFAMKDIELQFKNSEKEVSRCLVRKLDGK